MKYAGVVSGDESITMKVCIMWEQPAAIQPLMLFFKNMSRSYPARGVPGVCHPTSPRAWMDETV